jgi:hypothetical protein
MDDIPNGNPHALLTLAAPPAAAHRWNLRQFLRNFIVL